GDRIYTRATRLRHGSLDGAGAVRVGRRRACGTHPRLARTRALRARARCLRNDLRGHPGRYPATTDLGSEHDLGRGAGLAVLASKFLAAALWLLRAHGAQQSQAAVVHERAHARAAAVTRRP